MTCEPTSTSLLELTVFVLESCVHITGDAIPFLHTAGVHGVHSFLPGTEPPVAPRPEEVGVVAAVLSPAQRCLDMGHREAQPLDGLRPGDLRFSIKHPVVLTCAATRTE